MLNANALYRGVDSENEIRRFTRTFSNFHCSAWVFHAVAGPDMAPSKAVKLPPCCGVRGCYGDVAYKSDFRLQCKTSLNHTGWLVELNGARQWEFTTRGRSSVKGIVVEPKSVEQHENPILQDETEEAKPTNQLVKGSEGDVVSSVALVTASQPETAVVEDPTLNALSSAPPVVAERATSEQGLGAPAVARLDVDSKELAAHGYKLCRTPTELAASRAKPKAKRGRKPKLHNEAFQKIVHNAISPHIIDSEQVAVLGRGAKRRMVLAKHLTKTKHRIFQEDKALQKTMSWSNFHRIMAIYFPYIKNPRRKTDICILDRVFAKPFSIIFIHFLVFIDLAWSHFTPFVR